MAWVVRIEVTSCSLLDHIYEIYVILMLHGFHLCTVVVCHTVGGRVLQVVFVRKCCSSQTFSTHGNTHISALDYTLAKKKSNSKVLVHANFVTYHRQSSPSWCVAR